MVIVSFFNVVSVIPMYVSFLLLSFLVTDKQFLLFYIGRLMERLFCLCSYSPEVVVGQLCILSSCCGR